MTREQRIIETFVELADTMVDQFDVVEFLHRVAQHCVTLLDCAEAGLLLADASGALRVMASSSERVDALDVLQCQNEEGPCFECYHHGRPVFSENLEADHGRWPAFVPVAVESGFLSMQAIPMRVRGRTIGALNLCRAVPGRIAERDLPIGQGMADIAAIALLQQPTTRATRDVTQQLQSALTSRVVIEQAKGVLAQQEGIAVDVAFTRLRAHARAHNQRLSDVAHGLVNGHPLTATLDDPASKLSSRGSSYLSERAAGSA
jgi:transcriptional regulator with GAF, ATPase, and Fis domain